ncbi:MAG: substrate-binding domain-containing protein [Proteobacteria bacterium]|nr:substrate-binding domain-containing protein [Pseudomonadota bacterium]
MYKFRILLISFALAATLVPGVACAQLKVIISGGFSAAYQELLPEFERTTGITAETTRGGSVGSNPRTIPNQIRSGVEADVVILARQGLEEIREQGRILAGTDVDLARSIIGMAVQAGAAKPDISTPEALTAVLLQAESVAVSSSTSGRYLTEELFPRLGITAAMAGKTLTTGAIAVGRGEAEIGFQQVSEILPIEGADLAGTIPEELQFETTYSAAIITGSAQYESAKQLIEFLSSSEAAAAISKSGMEPVNR